MRHFGPQHFRPGLALGVALLLAALELVGLPGLAPAGSPAVAGETLSASARDQNGEVYPWTAARGDLLVIDFAASWCAPCRVSLPRLEAFARAHPEMEILVVSEDETAAGRDRLVEELDLTLPVLWDENHRIAEHYHPTSMPHTVVVDGEGLVLRRLEGSSEADWDELVAWLKRQEAGR